MPSSGSPTRRGGGSSSRPAVNRPLYAIDFTAVACGKRIANTKRRVRWRFGFANPDALEAGETGTACRGEEHDVTLVWSVTSGKRLILADGQEVHYSNSRSAVIDFSWTMRGNHVLKVVAHATAPMSADPGFRQYDFFVDGRSFFSFPKVYRLGLTGSKTMSPEARRVEGSRSGMAESSSRRRVAGQNGGSIAAIEAPHNPDEEEAYLREAIKASLEDEAKRKQGEKTSDRPKISAEATDLLIDFMDDFDAGGATAAPVAGNEWALAPAPSAGNEWAMAPAPAAGNEWAMAPAPVQPANQWAQSPAQPDSSWAMASPPPPAPQPAYDQFGAYDQYGGGAPAFASAPANPFAPAPVQSFAAPAPASDPFAAPAFAAPPAYGRPAPAPAVAPAASDPFAAAPASTQKHAPTANGAAANPVLTMGSLATDGLLSGGVGAPASPARGGGTTMADKALQNLMGSIDSFGITGSAAKPTAAKNPFDSNNILSNATLGEIKSAKSAERKPVMNAPPGPGAMVMAQSQGGNWGGYGGMGMGGGGGMQAPPAQYSMSGGYPQQGQMGAMQAQMGGSQMGGFGMGIQQQPMMMGGQQQPPMGQQQGYGPPPQYGQQPPMQQNQWGAPSY